MANENSFENFGLQPNFALKTPKPRLPLQELNNVLQLEDENTAMMQARKRRVSFANVNTIKEFNTGAESLLVCHTPAYEEPFSACSDSSNPSTHEAITPAKSEDCEDVGNSALIPNCLSFSNYNKRVSIGNSRVSLGPDRIGSEDMDCTDVLKTAYMSANTSSMEITAAVQGVFNASHLSINSSKMTKTKYYNSMSCSGNNMSENGMDFTEVIHHHNVFENTRTPNNSTENGMELTEAISPLLQEGSMCMDTTAESEMELPEKSHEGSKIMCNITDTGMEMTSAIAQKFSERTEFASNTTSSRMELSEAVYQQFQDRNTVDNILQSGMELTSAVVPIFNERTRYVSNMTSSRMELTETVHQQFKDRNKTGNSISQSGMELTSAAVPIFNERTRSVGNMSSSKMELTEAAHHERSNVSRISQSGMELMSAAVPILNERSTSVGNMSSSKMELTEAAHQERNKTVKNFSQSGMELTSGAVPTFNERTRYVDNMTSSGMELTEAVYQQFQDKNKIGNSISQSGMELTNIAVPIFNERTSSVGNMLSSKMELTEAAHLERNKTINNFSQTGMELTSSAAPTFNERTTSVGNMSSNEMELTEAAHEERNKTVNTSSQSGMELTGPLHLKSCNEVETKSRVTQSEIELTEQSSKSNVMTQSANSMLQTGMELTDVMVPKFQEKTNLSNSLTSSGMEFTMPASQREQKQSKSVTSFSQNRMELTESVLNRTPCTGTESVHSKLSESNTLNIEDNRDSEIEIDDKISIDVGQNSKRLNSLDADNVELTERSHLCVENKTLGNTIQNMADTVLSESNKKSNILKIEKVVLTEADFPEQLMGVTNDNNIKQCTRTGSYETSFQNTNGYVHVSITNNRVNEEVVAECVDPKVWEKESTNYNLTNRIQDKSSNSFDISVGTVTYNNEMETESMKNDSLSLDSIESDRILKNDCIECTDKKETQERVISCTDQVKLNETVHNLSKTKYNRENHSMLSCADQSEHLNIGSCSRLEMTGIIPLDEEECDKNNLVERHIVTEYIDRTLNTEPDFCSTKRTCNSELCDKNAGVNNIYTENIESEVALNVADQVETNKVLESSITPAKDYNIYDSEVEMNLDKRDCASSNDEEEAVLKNKTSTRIIKLCQDINSETNYVNCEKRSFENDNLKSKIAMTEINSGEEICESIINSIMNRKSGQNKSHVEDVISNSSCQGDDIVSSKKHSVLKSTHSSAERVENIDAMEVGGDDIVNSSRNYACFDSVSASNADLKTESETHKPTSIKHSTSGSVKIQNRTEISTLGSKRKYASLENMGPADESNNPPKIYVQEQVRSNFDNNVVNNMEVIVNAADDIESGNNKEVVTNYTVEIGSPQSNKHNISCSESNKKDSSMLPNSDIVNDESYNHNTNTTQSSVADISVHENIVRSDINNDLFQSLVNHSNITFRRKSKSLLSMKKNRSQINNQLSPGADFQNNTVSHSIVMNTEITITNVKLSNVNPCSSFNEDKRKCNVECVKTPLTPLIESVKENNNPQGKTVQDSNIKQTSSTGGRTHFKTTVVNKNLINNRNHIQENTKKGQDFAGQQSNQMGNNEVSALQQIPRDFREKWNLYEVAHGVWSLDLIPEVLLVIFKIGEHTKYDDDVGIVKITYKEIWTSSEDSVKSYMAKIVMAKFSTRDMKKICNKSSQIPYMIQHVNAFVQRTIEFGKYLKVLIDIYCAVLDNKMLTFEVCSARSRLWIKVYVNLESYEYLSAADITVSNIKGNIEQSVIRKIFGTVKGRQNTLYEFVTKVDHYIRVERSLKAVTSNVFNTGDKTLLTSVLNVTTK